MVSFRGAVAGLLMLALVVETHAVAPPRRPRLPEGLRMFVDILADKETGPGSGWFGPSESVYGWSWLARQLDTNGDGVITQQEFRGPASLFHRLDRDGDRRLTAADFDWS